MKEVNKLFNSEGFINEKFLSDVSIEEDAELESVLQKINETNITIDDINDFLTSELNEGIIGSIVGGLTGLALGKTVGQAIAKVLGVEKGVLYDLLCDRLVATAIGSVLGNKVV